MNDSKPPKPKRRWYQFSLRTLIVLLIAGGMVLGWRHHRAGKNRERVAAVEKAVVIIQELGGRVGYEYGQSRSATWLEELFDDPGSSNDPVRGLRVSEVVLRGTNVIDAELEHLKELTNVKWVSLAHAKVTDAGLEHLKGLTNLESLYLIYTNVTDAGLEHLRGLTTLKHLYLYDTNVTDKGVKKLRQALPNCWIHHEPKPLIDSRGECRRNDEARNAS